MLEDQRRRTTSDLLRQSWELFRRLTFGLLLVFCVFPHIGLHTVSGLQKITFLGLDTDLRFLWVINPHADVGAKIFNNWSKLCLSTTLISLVQNGIKTIPHYFGEINIVLNQDIIHLFPAIHGTIVLVKLGYYIMVAQMCSIGEFEMFRSQPISRSWNRDSSYTKRGIFYSKIFSKNSHISYPRTNSRLNLSYCWKDHNFYSFWNVQV